MLVVYIIKIFKSVLFFAKIDTVYMYMSIHTSSEYMHGILDFIWLKYGIFSKRNLSWIWLIQWNLHFLRSLVCILHDSIELVIYFSSPFPSYSYSTPVLSPLSLFSFLRTRDCFNPSDPNYSHKSPLWHAKRSILLATCRKITRPIHIMQMLNDV